MDHGYVNPPPTVTASGAGADDEPLFRTSPPEERTPSLRRPPQQGLQPQPMPQQNATFGAPPMGEPSEPSAHPDNIVAATQSLTRPEQPAAGTGLGRQSSGSFSKVGILGRQPSGSF